MQRLIHGVVTTARSAGRLIRHRSGQLAIVATVSASTLAGASSAQAFGGHHFGGGQHSGGERIVSSQVVSDVAVGESYDGGEMVQGGEYGGGGVQNREYGQPDLFYNYYTQGGANSANAQMYVAPVPVPPNVGNTYLTYQPFYPHEMLYPHKDKFHNYYDNGRGLNRTKVNYSTSPVHSAVKNFYWNVLRIPR